MHQHLKNAPPFIARSALAPVLIYAPADNGAARRAAAENVRIIIRPCRSRSAAAYCDQTFSWTICRSVGRCVGLSIALWKNGGSDADAVWHHRSDGSRHEAVGFGIGLREGVLLRVNL